MISHPCPNFNCGLVNSLRPRQNGRLFADDTFNRIFLNENIRISTKNSLKFVPKGLINNIPALVLIMAWHRPGDKLLSEPMLVRSLTHICVTRPQWVKLCFCLELEWVINYITQKTADVITFPCLIWVNLCQQKVTQFTFLEQFMDTDVNKMYMSKYMNTNWQAAQNNFS